MFTEVHSAFSEFLYIFRSFILNVYTDLDFFYYYYLFWVFLHGKWQGCSHFGLFLSYVALRSQHTKPKREDPAVWNGF